MFPVNPVHAPCKSTIPEGVTWSEASPIFTNFQILILSGVRESGGRCMCVCGAGVDPKADYMGGYKDTSLQKMSVLLNA